MDNLTILYDDVFPILPISYSGIANFDKELNKFLEKLTESNFLKYNPNITLLFSAMLQFPKDKGKATQWELESLKNIFFKTFVEGDKRAAINFYFGLLNKFSVDKDLGDDFSMTKTLSKFFIQPIDFKISLDENSNEPLVSFDRRNDVFNIILPQKELFYNKLKHASRQKEINDIFVEYKLYNNIFTKFGNRYEFNLSGNKSAKDLDLIKNIFQNIFNCEEVDGIAKNIIDQLDYLEQQQTQQLNDFKLPKIFEKQDKLCYSKIAYGSIAISFLCYYYDSTLEYLLSIGNKKYENGTSKYQNLGGLVLGYNSKTNLSDYERTIFNIISDRLASVLVCHSLYEDNREQKYKNLRIEQKNILDEFKSIISLPPNLDHFAVELNDEILVKINSFLKKHTDSFTKFGLNYFKENITNLCQINNRIGKGIFCCIHRNEEVLNDYKIKEIPYYSCLRTGEYFFKDESVINIGIINQTIDFISKNKDSPLNSIETYPISNFVYIHFNFNKPISLKDLANSIQNTHKGGGSTGGLGIFFKSIYETILISGNLEIGFNDPANSNVFKTIINFKDDFSFDEKNRNLIFSKDINEIINTEYNEVVYKFTFE